MSSSVPSDYVFDFGVEVSFVGNRVFSVTCLSMCACLRVSLCVLMCDVCVSINVFVFLRNGGCGCMCVGGLGVEFGG